MSGQPTSIHIHALVDILDLIKEQLDAEEEREWQADHAAHLAKQALLNLPANQT